MKLSKNTISAARRLPSALNRAYSSGGNRSTATRPFTAFASDIGASSSTGSFLYRERREVHPAGLNGYRGFASETPSKGANVGFSIFPYYLLSFRYNYREETSFRQDLDCKPVRHQVLEMMID
jgi:hypothetical protein